jgi:Xaa-Pro aminopeptidase
MNKIEKIREYLKKEEISAYFANTQDNFLSEYTLPQNNEVLQITGFTGSNGYVLIAQNKSLFFTDGRYLLQAKNELPNGFEIHHIKDFQQILKEQAFKVLALDFTRIAKKFTSSMEKHGVKLEHVESFYTNLCENNANYYVLPEGIVGDSALNKIAKVQECLKSANKDGFFISNPQNVCWLLNIRGNDEPYTPIYKTTLFVTGNNYMLNPKLEQISGNVFLEDEVSYANFCKINAEKHFSNFITNLKAVKNSVEIEGMVNTHKIDGKILTKFLQLLEEDYNGKTEYEISQNLLEFRGASEYFKMPSFATICGCNANGAIIHYNATKGKAKTVRENSVILIDSGGQYADFSGKNKILGTTDVTRTIFVGENPTEKYKKVFTLVLKGHIAIATAEFSKDTPSSHFDAIARKYLLEHYLNYDHSTGHGVGAFLSVHEAGCGFSSKNNEPLKAGMVISNEPGCYIEGEFGIRIESLVLVCEKANGMLYFQTLTLVPIQEKSVDFTLLTQQEKTWLAEYNKIALENLINRLV